MDINTEMGIVLDSESLTTRSLERLFQVLPTNAYRLRLDADGDIEWAAQENNTERVYRKEPQVGFWRRVSVGFYRILPIEGHL